METEEKLLYILDKNLKFHRNKVGPEGENVKTAIFYIFDC